MTGSNGQPNEDLERKADETTSAPNFAAELPSEDFAKDSSRSAQNAAGEVFSIIEEHSDETNFPSKSVLSEAQAVEQSKSSALNKADLNASLKNDGEFVAFDNKISTEPLLIHGSEATETDKQQATSLNLTQQHVSHLLSDVLQDGAQAPSPFRKLRIPIIFDCLLGAGLLVAVGGFTIGLVQMYLVHSASQNISEQRYKAAISILKSVPVPQVFARLGSDTEEMLSKARYLDAVDAIENSKNIPEALNELREIKQGSRYYALAQQSINENSDTEAVTPTNSFNVKEVPPNMPPIDNTEKAPSPFNGEAEPAKTINSQAAK